MFYVYILKSRKNGNIYIGFTSDLRKRLEEHNSGKTKSTSYRTPLDLVYYEAYKSRDDAEKREKMLKIWGRTLGGLKRRIKKSLES